MQSISLAGVGVSRLLLGSNPFSGFSHQGRERDAAMVRHYTAARIKETLFEAERLGITGLVARTDQHVIRLLMEYRDEGGRLKWFAQTCPGVGPTEMCVRRALGAGAVACHVHGGVMDHLVAKGKTDEAKRAVDLIREGGIPAGIAGHNVRVFERAERHLDVDYYMCCYYNPTRRDEDPSHPHGAEEKFRDEDRAAMTALIRALSKPVIHYKILAAGRNDPAEAFRYAARAMRPQDAACVGVFTGDDADMLAKDVALFGKAISGVSSG
ncbi:MAG: hypothetical protein ACYTKD_17880 [Planctomycetota bacterium]|jgi:hypothetical protein